MSTRELGRVALKVLGVYWGVSAIGGLLPALSLLKMPEESFLPIGRTSTVASAFGGVVFWAVAAAFLLIEGDALADRLFAQAPADVPYGATRPLVHAGVAVVGVALAASGLADTVRLIVEILWYLGADRREYFQDRMLLTSLPQTGTGVLAFLVGTVVALRAERIAARVVRERVASG